MGIINYERNTTFTLGINYNNTNGVAGSKALFTVKPVQYDANNTDSTAILQKDITLVSNQGVATISPTDIPDTQDPGKLYYDVKVLDTTGAIYMIDSGKFYLTANPTNRET